MPLKVKGEWDCRQIVFDQMLDKVQGRVQSFTEERLSWRIRSPSFFQLSSLLGRMSMKLL